MLPVNKGSIAFLEGLSSKLKEADPYPSESNINE